MAWSTPKGFNFRNTSAFVADGANETYVLPTDAYPTTRTIGGEPVTFGWESVTSTNGRDRSAASPYEPELSGIAFVGPSDTLTTAVFRVDLPAAGSFAINVAAGDQAGTSKAFFEIDDTATSLIAFGPITLAGGSYVDAAGTSRTATDWQANNVAASKTFATSIFRLKVHQASVNASPISHLTLTESGVPQAPTITSVNGGAAIAEGATAVALVGTGFAAGMTVNLVQGATTIAQANVNVTNATAATFDVVTEPGSGAQAKFDSAGATTAVDVVVSGHASDPLACPLVVPNGQLYVDVTSVNSSSTADIQASPALAVGDQIEASGSADGTAAAPTGLQLNADTTYQYTTGHTPVSFWARAWDSSTSTWGAWALQSVTSSGSILLPLLRLLGIL